jgi:uncharacterized protein (UPF0335 family)
VAATNHEEPEMAKQSEGPRIGDNSLNGGQLKAFIERIERLMEEKKGVADDIKDIYAEAKGKGFDTKIMRKAVRIRAMNKEKWRKEEETLDLYLAALGLL